MVPAGSPGAGTTPTPFAGQAYVRTTPSARKSKGNNDEVDIHKLIKQLKGTALCGAACMAMLGANLFRAAFRGKFVPSMARNGISLQNIFEIRYVQAYTTGKVRDDENRHSNYGS